MRLIAYIRVSTEEQADRGHSLGHQLERLRAFCALAEHELVDVIADEGVSASIPLAKRKGGAQLIAALRASTADGVAVIRIDRLFRNLLDGVRFFEEELADTGASVHSLAESIDASSPSGWLALVMQLATADYARRLDAQRARETSAALRQSGKVYGQVPYGCIAVGGERYFDDAQDKHRVRGAQLLRDPQTWPHRETIVRMRVEGFSYGQIAETFRKLGILNPNGCRTWSKSTLKSIVDTHSSLLHLPLAQVALQVVTNPEIGVSAHGAN